MQIQFKQIQFTEVSLNVVTSDVSTIDNFQKHLKVEHVFSNDNTKAYTVIFYFSLKNTDDSFNLKIKAEAHFTTDEDIDEEFKKSSFVKANSPAIAFPFVRTFISNFTLNSGFTPLVLPSINFVKLSETNEGDI